MGLCTVLSGWTQEVAERIGRAATRRLFESRVLAMDEYDKMLLPDEVRIARFFVTTVPLKSSVVLLCSHWSYLWHPRLGMVTRPTT